MEIDSIISERLKRPINKYLNITPKTTPIIYFGNYDSARACTISLNPSEREFIDEHGNILNKFEERLISREKLGKKDEEALTDEDVLKVLDGCKNYFKKNPYNWFDRMEEFIRNFGYSYYDDSCVGLDLVQWATTPFWGELDDETKRNHLNNDKHVLEHLLNKNKDFEKIFLNGETVVSEFKKCFRYKISLQEYLMDYKKQSGSKIKIYYGYYNTIKIIGWSRYLKYASTEIIIKRINEIIEKE